MNKINVLHIDTERGWRGGQQQGVYLFENMHNDGFKTEFICRPNSSLEEYFIKNNLPYKSVKMRNELDIFSAYKISRYCKKSGFNILHLHSAHALSIGLLAKLFYRKLKLVGVRRVDFSIRKNIFSKFKYSTKFLDRLVCISKGIKNVVLKDGVPKDKLEVIHSGININKFKDVKYSSELKSSISHDNKIIVGTVAALTGHKDYPNFLKASKVVLEHNKNVVFLALGSGPNEEEIKALHKDLELGDNFKFGGFKKNIGEYLKVFDIFVMPSKLEGLGTSILDAESVGLPIIGTDAGGIPEALENGFNGLIVPAKNHIALAEAIEKLASSEELRKKLGDNSLEFVKKYDINITVKKNIELYGRLV